MDAQKYETMLNGLGETGVKIHTLTEYEMSLLEEAEAEREARRTALRETQDLRDQLRWRTAQYEGGHAYKAAYLKRLTEYQRTALITMRRLAIADGWVSRDAVRRAAGKRAANQITTLWLLDLVERRDDSGYRLTPFGTQVAAALSGEEK